MSLHIIYTHQCSNCEAYYIPYAKGVKCPRCGIEEDDKEAYEVISQIVESANYQKSRYGVYTPLAWWNGSYADHIAFYLFKLFDKYDKQKEKDFNEFSLDFIMNSQWKDQEYAKHHIYDIAQEVFQKLKNDKE